MKRNCLVLFLLSLSFEQTIAQVIEINNSRQAMTVTDGDLVTVAIHHPGGMSVDDYDWWIAVATTLPAPDHLFYFDGASWTREPAVAFQQPLVPTEGLELLSGRGFPPGSYTFYFGVDPIANGIVDLATLEYTSLELTSQASVAANAASCGNSRQWFSVDPLEADAYWQIDPLGATNPSGHTFPTVHTYMMLSDNTVPRDVFAPADIDITQINVVENLSAGGTDYSLNFSLCPELSGYFDHLSALNQSLVDSLGEQSQCQQYMAGSDEYRFCSYWVSVSVPVGTRLGSAGGGTGQLSAALDFGLRDQRITALTYANPERLVNSDQHYVVCPYDYYSPGPVKAGLVAKLAVARQDQPFCGTVALDVPGSAQGRWYLQGSTDFGENDHLALVPSNKAPATVGVLSVGNSSVGTDAYFFDFQDEGSRNRRFSAIGADGQTYCYDSLRNREASIASGNGQGLPGILFLQMTDSESLILERSTALLACPEDTGVLSFGVDAVAFER